MFILVGLMIMAGVYWAHTQQAAFANIAQTTIGTVIDMRQPTGGTRAQNRGYYPVVQFITPGEHVYTFDSAITTNPPSYTVGDKIEVLYNPERPEEAVIAAHNSIATNHGMWFAVALGVVLILVGIHPNAKVLKT